MRKRTLWLILFTIAGILVCAPLVLGEVMLRLQVYQEMKHGYFTAKNTADLQRIQAYDPHCIWTLLPNISNFPIKTHSVMLKEQAIPHPFTVSTNEIGSRGKPLCSDEKCVRIVTLGDSTTFGLGVNNAETWPAQLEDLLNRENNGARYEVINLGVTGYSAFQCLQVLRYKALKLSPSLIIITTGNNDPTYMEGWADQERAKLYASKSAFSMNSVLFSTTCQAWHAANSKKIEKSRARITPEEYTQILGKFDEISQKEQIPLLCILWPWAPQLRGEQPDELLAKVSQYQKVLLKTTEEQGTPVINLFDYWKKDAANYYLDWVHVNPEGCHSVASILSRYIKDTLKL